MVFINTTTTTAPVNDAATRAPSAPPAQLHAAFAAADVTIRPAATATPAPPASADASASDIVTLAEKMRICEYYAELNNAPSTATFNNLYKRMHLDTDDKCTPTTTPTTTTTTTAATAATTPTASPVTPLSPTTTPPTTPPCTPANPPPTWQPSADTPAAQIAAALHSVSFNGVKPTSVAHLLQLRALQSTSLQHAQLPQQQHDKLYDQYQQQYITALETARTNLRQVLRSRIRDAIKLRCIKPRAMQKCNKPSSSKLSRASKSRNTSKSRANAAAAAAAAAARVTNATETVPTVVSALPSDMSLEDRVHRLFRAHRFMLHESEKILAHMRVAYEHNISPILSDDDMEDDHQATDRLPHGASNGGGNGDGNGDANGANRTMVNVAN